jgi:hypothetical protein
MAKEFVEEETMHVRELQRWTSSGVEFAHSAVMPRD